MRELSLLLLLLPTASHAQVFDVTRLDDPAPALVANCASAAALTPGTLRWAFISAMAVNGTVRPMVAGTVPLSSFCRTIKVVGPMTYAGAHTFVVDGSALNANIFTIDVATTVSFNRMLLQGGAGTRGIDVLRGHLVFNDGRIRGNDRPTTSAGNGAGILVRNPGRSNLTVVRSHLAGNKSNAAGGAIFFDGRGTLSVSDSLIETNLATTFGGGIMFSADNSTVAVSMIRHSTISHNTGPNRGGGVAIDTTGTPPLKIQDSTISNNSCATEGGGITLERGGFELYACTIADNLGFDATQICVKPLASTARADSTIISGNVPSCLGGGVGIMTGMYNVVSDTQCGNLQGRIPAAAHLLPLTNNGGGCGGALFSCLTRRPIPPSAAIDHTLACMADDQRHVVRGPAPCWTGAFEN